MGSKEERIQGSNGLGREVDVNWTFKKDNCELHLSGGS